MAKKIKVWYQSRTIQIAILQAILSVITVFATEYPEIGALLFTKSMIDVYIRVTTTQTIK